MASVRPASTRLPVVPLPDWVAYPELTMPLHASRAASVDALAAADNGDLVVVVTQRRARKTVDPQHLCSVGTAAKVIRRLRMPDGGVQVLLEGQYRASVDEITPVGDYFEARVTPLTVHYAPSLELEALRRVVVAHVEGVGEETNMFAPETVAMTRRAADPGWLADYVAFSSDMSPHERQTVLETLDLTARLRFVARYLAKQVEILNIRNKIQGEIQDGIEKVQRDYYLREQLRAIQRELGMSTPQTDDAQDLSDRVDASDLPDDVADKARQEISRLGRHAADIARGGRDPRLPGLAAGVAVGVGDPRPPELAARPPGAGPRPLRVGEAQGAGAGIPGRACHLNEVPDADRVFRRSPGRGQDEPGPLDRAGAWPRVRAHLAGRRARRGGDSGTPAHLRGGAAGPHHPGAAARRLAQPGNAAGRDRQDRPRLSGRPIIGVAGSAGPGVQPQLFRTTTWKCRSTCRGCCS